MEMQRAGGTAADLPNNDLTPSLPDFRPQARKHPTKTVFTPTPSNAHQHHPTSSNHLMTRSSCFLQVQRPSLLQRQSAIEGLHHQRVVKTIYRVEAPSQRRRRFRTTKELLGRSIDWTPKGSSSRVARVDARDKVFPAPLRLFLCRDAEP
jgi:hypothetical protein